MQCSKTIKYYNTYYSIKTMFDLSSPGFDLSSPGYLETVYLPDINVLTGDKVCIPMKGVHTRHVAKFTRYINKDKITDLYL